MTLFHDESWDEPWRSSEFPPEETPQERWQRFNKKPGWSNGWHDWVPRLFRTQAGKTGHWPWGYVIYRTTFTETSDQDWAAAIEILDRYCSTSMDHWKDLKEFEHQPNIIELVREGYRNVIVQDSSLEGPRQTLFANDTFNGTMSGGFLLDVVLLGLTIALRWMPAVYGRFWQARSQINLAWSDTST